MLGTTSTFSSRYAQNGLDLHGFLDYPVLELVSCNNIWGAPFSRGGTNLSDNPTFLTREGLAKLEDELDFLKSSKRKEVAERIKIAVSYGDLSENSEYDAAKDEQAFVESRIVQLEKMMRNIRIIEPGSEDRSSVSIGVTVKLKEVPDGDVETYQIVGTTESDPLDGKISNESPLGSSLIGRQVGDRITVNTPGGQLEFEIIEIA
ncbi:transcription elongation factor GreA [Tumebacillus sp. ITR2]|uniref:Transcription elongation factor GreA n=1 Tax=Tumebacillus amylolyticus TaxID=2801339 RepID=A0ABS1J8E8_9BACL|nr:transcription elongation factor GreA [Tumebacillus amylolyticus]